MAQSLLGSEAVHEHVGYEPSVVSGSFLCCVFFLRFLSFLDKYLFVFFFTLGSRLQQSQPLRTQPRQ